MKFFLKAMISIGNFFIGTSCLLLLLGLTGVISLDVYSYGLSSGVRMVGAITIAGCLLSAVGSYILENSNE